MLELSYTHQFKKDLKLVEKRGKKLGKINVIVDFLCAEKSLPAKNRNHKLGGRYADHWECHMNLSQYSRMLIFERFFHRFWIRFAGHTWISSPRSGSEIWGKRVKKHTCRILG